jgi:hypothetical protein
LLTTLRQQDCQYWLAYLGMQCRLHELRHKRRISVAAASKILANLVYSYKGMGLSMGTMCAGVTPEEGPALYYIDSDGTRLPGNLFCVGSGQTFAYGVLDAEYHYDLEDDEALELGKRSILRHTETLSPVVTSTCTTSRRTAGSSTASWTPTPSSGRPSSRRASSATSLLNWSRVVVVLLLLDFTRAWDVHERGWRS